MRKFPHIDALYQVARYVADTPDEYKISTSVMYLGTIKLHGTNSGVCCTPEKLTPQSRTRELTIEDDNYGFAKFVTRDETVKVIREVEEAVRGLNNISKEVPLTLFGEWIGPGIQKGVAINQLPEKQWVIFAALTEDKIMGVPVYTEMDNPARVYCIIETLTYSLTIDFADTQSKENALNVAMQYTQQVDTCCPWAARFGITGPGEGIVWTPLGEHRTNTNLYFKTKGDKHKVVKSKQSKPQVVPEVLESIDAFVTFSVTENRLNQGLAALKETGNSIDIKSMSFFLKWIGQDIKRECALELKDNKLEWKQVGKEVSKKARVFFLETVTEL